MACSEHQYVRTPTRHMQEDSGSVQLLSRRRHFHVLRGLESAQRFVDGAEDRAEQRQYQQAVAAAQQQAARAQVGLGMCVRSRATAHVPNYTT